MSPEELEARAAELARKEVARQFTDLLLRPCSAPAGRLGRSDRSLKSRPGNSPARAAGVLFGLTGGIRNPPGTTTPVLSYSRWPLGGWPLDLMGWLVPRCSVGNADNAAG
jgi:hypothetical protein